MSKPTQLNTTGVWLRRFFYFLGLAERLSLAEKDVTRVSFAHVVTLSRLRPALEPLLLRRFYEDDSCFSNGGDPRHMFLFGWL
jgi:hypothetical protein